jgi:hypothetical protein
MYSEQAVCTGLPKADCLTLPPPPHHSHVYALAQTAHQVHSGPLAIQFFPGHPAVSHPAASAISACSRPGRYAYLPPPPRPWDQFPHSGTDWTPRRIRGESALLEAPTPPTRVSGPPVGGKLFSSANGSLRPEDAWAESDQ